MVAERNETKKNEGILIDARQIWTTSLYITMPKFEVQGRKSHIFLDKNTQNALIHPQPKY